MINNRGRDKETAIAAQACPEIDVAVFIISDKILIEPADILKYLLTVDCRSRTGTKDLLRLQVGRCRFRSIRSVIPAIPVTSSLEQTPTFKA